MSSGCHTLLDYSVIYCKEDVSILAGVFKVFHEIFRDEFGFTPSYKDIIRIARLSFTTYYRRPYNAIDITNITSDRNIDKIIRKGYYGGKTEVFSRTLNDGELCYSYDFPSMYGIAMCEMLPVGPVIQYDTSNIIDVSGYILAFDARGLVGFISVDFVAPNIECPVLPVKAKTRKSRGVKLMFCVGKGSGTYYTKELIYAMSLGYKVLNIHKVLAFKGGYPLKSHVSKLITRKSEAGEAGNNVLKTIYKMLITNLYGKFGMNIDSKTTITPATSVEFLRPLKDVVYMDNYAICQVHDPKAGRHRRSTNVSIAAAVTAHGRIILHSSIMNVLKTNHSARLIYCDTDRMFFAACEPILCRNM